MDCVGYSYIISLLLPTIMFLMVHMSDGEVMMDVSVMTEDLVKTKVVMVVMTGWKACNISL